jgi:hypothetical protein
MKSVAFVARNKQVLFMRTLKSIKKTIYDSNASYFTYC